MWQPALNYLNHGAERTYYNQQTKGPFIEKMGQLDTGAGGRGLRLGGSNRSSWLFLFPKFFWQKFGCTKYPSLSWWPDHQTCFIKCSLSSYDGLNRLFPLRTLSIQSGDCALVSNINICIVIKVCNDVHRDSKIKYSMSFIVFSKTINEKLLSSH